MITLIKQVSCIFVAFGSGLVVSGAVFAFITAIGVVPRLAQKTKTIAYIKLYEEALIAGGIFGTCIDFFEFNFRLGTIPVILYSLSVGIFFGCVAMSLAEVLNVIPILSRRARIQKGMSIFVVCIACGKLVGALMYFLIPGFYKP